MVRLKRSHFLATAVVFHLLYVYSDLRHLVPDGLRADKTFQQFPDPSPDAPTDESAQVPRHLAPFLRSRVLKHGTFGVSHTRVPTESRPGHVALVAGLYEDVSAVTTGWKLNPVGFDSVLNRSRHAWSWDIPDILPMFAQGGRTRPRGYRHVQRRGGRLQQGRHRARYLGLRPREALLPFRHRRPKLGDCPGTRSEHLLSPSARTGHSGHSFRPYSCEYLHNLQVVNNGTTRRLLFLPRGHGMSDLGSHGDGHPDNTRTPLIARGTGVARPKAGPLGNVAAGHDEFSADWHLDHVQRHDVAQADIAALMAYLAGILFPVNSVGRLPLPYLNAYESSQAETMLVNALEILEMYRVRESRMMASKLWYVPFPALSHDQDPEQEERIARIRNAIRCEDLIDLSLQGLRYLQTYDWLFLRALTSVGYLGWMAFALMNALSHFDVPSADMMGFVSLALLMRLYSQKSPMQYFEYAVFPVLFWAEVWACQDTWTQTIRALPKRISASNVTADVAVIMIAGFPHSSTLWPAIYGIEFIHVNRLVCLAWAVQCGAMSIFTLLPAMKTEELL
ncbi:hypothetical protein BO82DRAFT_372807 [Aspergillus uvarum CBS 121591]|uniref:GPI ethanolamine phosphate transferase 1 n=1 Tax=Aspergillus uvarum CBS 121591 TaxID=1448315 RepID=A0A319CFJ2_9EURO|nr:hypothetical protein BO82DRAFT_372807 [Aspergillus uvarum CBS 121591]PYH84014.1 hypothetical protein BO82DRAFT_372807 [Aspergillus uvarum CBS 121591]